MVHDELLNYDVKAIREQFPLLSAKKQGTMLAYLDSAATTQKPQSVINAVARFYENDNANVHRGIYALSERATAHYEAVRQSVRQFIHAQHNHEIVFTRGATEAINLVAQSYGGMAIGAGDEVLISAMEHHSNIVPWQQLCQRQGARLRVVPLLENGALDLVQYRAMLSEKTKLVALIHVSNVLGVLNPVEEMIADAHECGVPVLIDGSQSVSHMKIDVQQLDCDFFVFSGHKMYGPTGVGVLYAKEKWLEAMPPYQFGGDMIRSVSYSETVFNVLPYKFEAGTPNVAGVVGLGEAVNFLQSLGVDALHQYEANLLNYLISALQSIEGVKVWCVDVPTVAVVSFVLESVHAHDVATILDEHGVAVRAGHHCAMPLMQELGVPATVRVSLAAYTTEDDIDRCLVALKQVNDIFIAG